MEKYWKTIRGIISKIEMEIISLKNFILEEKYVTLLFAILSLSVITWFRGFNYIHQIDSLFFLNPEKRLHDVLYTWRDGYSLGIGAPGTNLIPFYAFQTFLLYVLLILSNNYWISISLSQVVMYFLSVFYSFLFSYLFFKEFLQFLTKDKNRKFVTLSAILASIFYTINPHTLSMVFGRYQTWGVFWSAFPLYCYLFLRYLVTKQKLILFMIGILLLTPLSAAFSQPALLNLFLMFMIILIILSHLNIIDKKKVVKRSILFVVMFILLFFWGIITQILGSILTEKFTVFRNEVSNYKALQYASRFTTILNIIRLFGYYIIHSVYLDSFPFYWAYSYLHNPIIQTLLLLYPFLAFSTILIYIKSQRNILKNTVILLAVFYLFFILLMKGLAEPFPEVGKFLFSLHSIFFRHPYDRFIHIFVMINSLLFLMFCYRILSIKRNIIKIPIIASVLGVILYLGLPFFTGDIVHPSDRIDLSKTDYLKLVNLKLKNCTILVIPFSPTATYSYNLSYEVNHITFKSIIYEFLSDCRVIQFAFSPPEKAFLDHLARYIFAYDYRGFMNWMSLVGINYIVYQKDFSLKYEVYPYYKKLAKASIKFLKGLERLGYIEKIYENKNIILYKIKYNALPIIRIENKLIVVDTNRIYELRLENNYTTFLDIPMPGIYKFYVEGGGCFDIVFQNKTFKFRSSKPTVKYFGNIDLETRTYGITLVPRKCLIKQYNFEKFDKEREQWSKKIEYYIRISNPSVIKVRTYKTMPNWSQYSPIKTYILGGYLKNIYLVKQFYASKKRPANIAEFIKINPTFWKVYVNASKPFLLVFAEAYDPLWEARVYRDGKLVEKVRSIPVYGVINGFWINQIGNLTIIITYIPQDWFKLGLKISEITFIALLIYLIVPGECWRKLFEKFKSKIRQ